MLKVPKAVLRCRDSGTCRTQKSCHIQDYGPLHHRDTDFGFSRQDFSVVLEPVLELALEDQTDLKLTDLPASASQVMGLKVCVTITQKGYRFKGIGQGT